MKARVIAIAIATVLILFGATYLVARNADAAGAYPYALGGTGTTTPNIGQVVWWGTTNQKGIATGTITCAGTASCGAGSYVLGNSLTITGASSGSSPFASSSAFTAGQIPYATNTNGTPINLSAVSTTSATISSGLTYSGTFGALVGGVAGNLTCTTGSNTTFGCLTAANFLIFNNKVGTSSNATAGQLAYFTTTSGTPALISGVATGTVANGAGISVTAGQSVIGSGLTITNTGVTSLTATSPLSRDTATGAVTISCPTCSTATFLYPFIYATTYNVLSAASTTPFWFQGNGTYGLFASSTSVFDTASTTGLTVNSDLYIPNSANPAPGTTGGRIWVDTSTASSSIHFVANGTESALFASTSVAFTVATTSPVGTTTIVIAGSTRKVIYDQIGCTSVGGTVNVGFGNGTATSTSPLVVSGTSLTTTYTTLTTNNSFTQGVSRVFSLGGWSSTAITQVSCSLSQAYDPN